MNKYSDFYWTSLVDTDRFTCVDDEDRDRASSNPSTVLDLVGEVDVEEVGAGDRRQTLDLSFLLRPQEQLDLRQKARLKT